MKNPETKSILVVDDETGILKLFEDIIEDMGHSVHTFSSPKKALEAARKKCFDMAFIDLRMDEMGGMEMLKELKKTCGKTVAIMITAYGSVENAVKCMRDGAFDFITKPFQADEIRMAIQKVIERERLISENLTLKEKLRRIEGGGVIIGKSKAITDVMAFAVKAAKSLNTVLVTGESGTGKELIAKFIHDNSGRAQGEFVAVQCSNLAETLFESELFGHKKGAYTGAAEDKMGLFESADSGTVFLDEIGDIGMNLQGKLLRLLQEKEFRRVGETKSRQLDVRIIAATNKDLEAMIKEKKFREDLYYRLNVMRVHLPPLRDRKEDIPALAKYFMGLTEAGDRPGLSAEKGVFEKLMEYEWKGNIRELKNCIDNAAAICDGGNIKISDILSILPGGASSGSVNYRGDMNYRDSKKKLLSEFDRNYAISLLEKNSGNLSKSARDAGMNKKNFWSMLKKYGIKADEFKK